MIIKNNTLSSIYYMIFASMFIGGTTIIAKILGTDLFGKPLNPIQISHSRFFFCIYFNFYIFF